MCRPALPSALEETDRITRLAEQLLVLARIDAGELAEVQGSVVHDVGAAVDQILARTAVPPSLAVEVQVEQGAEPALDADSLDRLLTNLVSNAARFASSTIEVKVWRRDGRVTMTVADDGPGFPERVLERPFDRFVRADPARAGTGLGLAIVGSTARAARGEVALGNGEALGGAWVRVTLPAAATDAGSH